MPEDLGIPRDAVIIIIYEAPKTNWAMGGSCIRRSSQTLQVRIEQRLKSEFSLPI
ncbi:MAG TPA: hypothetical protein VK487_03235 [Candidatus Bathyarchaeia archaeon]|nr:hypothetical protein [Candidatus Bathyarchaeia archaeon]